MIFLMTDQQRWDALGVENPQVLTPHLDQLAREGVRYREAVCQAPMCVPSRLSMMTGLYPGQTGVRSNWDTTPGDDQLPFPVLPEALRRAGYQTAGFGKTHWGETRSEPSTRGFDTRVVGCRELGTERGAVHWQDDENPDGLAAYRRETADYGPGEEEVPGFIGTRSLLPERDHRDGWIAEKCLEWLDGGGPDPSRPLFFYLSFIKPHAGLNPPAAYEDLYHIEDIPDVEQPPWEHEPPTHLASADANNEFLGPRYHRWREAWERMSSTERRRTTLRYWANCTWLDALFGKALKRLRQLGRLDNALIVFVSDHGELLGERRHRFTKYCLYDSSVRVPFILSGSTLPESLRKKTSTRNVELVDLYPTLGAVAGASVPAWLPGENLFAPAQRKGTFAEFHDAGAPAWMWRTPAHKLITFTDPSTGSPRHELYDLQRDPHEWHNRAGDPEMADILRQLTEQARARSIETNRAKASSVPT